MGMTDVEKRALKGGIAFIEPIAAAIPEACRVSGMSRARYTGGSRPATFAP